MKKNILCFLTAFTLCSAACGTDSAGTPAADSSIPAESSSAARQGTYQQITQDRAKEMMQQNDGHVIVDVRRQDEYDSGHIPGAILLPNESIGTERPAALPDPEQIILVYCRSGRRSKEASQKLADMGYTNIYEFGGIIDWTGEIVTDAAPEDSGTDDAGDTETEENEMKLMIGDKEVPVTWEQNSAAEDLRALLPLTVDMSMYGGFEQVGPIGQRISRSDRQITTEPGDIVLYSGDQIVVFYGSNSWSYTKLGHIALSESELTALLGSGDVRITISQ